MRPHVLAGPAGDAVRALSGSSYVIGAPGGKGKTLGNCLSLTASPALAIDEAVDPRTAPPCGGIM